MARLVALRTKALHIVALKGKPGSESMATAPFRGTKQDVILQIGGRRQPNSGSCPN
jgi:hypothetical protein